MFHEFQVHHSLYRKDWQVMNSHSISKRSYRQAFRAEAAKSNIKWNLPSISHGNLMKSRQLYWISYKRWIWIICRERYCHLKINWLETLDTLDPARLVCIFSYANADLFMATKFQFRYIDNGPFHSSSNCHFHIFICLFYRPLSQITAKYTLRRWNLRWTKSSITIVRRQVWQ